MKYINGIRDCFIFIKGIAGIVIAKSWILKKLANMSKGPVHSYNYNRCI